MRRLPLHKMGSNGIRQHRVAEFCPFLADLFGKKSCIAINTNCRHRNNLFHGLKFSGDLLRCGY